MNLHMPQDEESEAELKNLAAVPYQIISPANNASIIGVFQDSLLGSYRFTRPNIKFDQRAAMNLLMAFNKVDTSVLKKNKELTSFDIMSQIMPPITIKFGNKWFEDSGEEYIQPCCGNRGWKICPRTDGKGCFRWGREGSSPTNL
jgi:DNA-directed RNA polymerase II subunit RPB1